MKSQNYAVRNNVYARAVDSHGHTMIDLTSGVVWEEIRLGLFNPVCDPVVNISLPMKDWYMEDNE